VAKPSPHQLYALLPSLAAGRSADVRDLLHLLNVDLRRRITFTRMRLVPTRFVGAGRLALTSRALPRRRARYHSTTAARTRTGRKGGARGGYTVALPYTGYYALLYRDRALSAFRRTWTFFRFLFHRGEQERLAQEGRGIIEQIWQLDQKLSA
jgi:hypothetical protein